jgi:hypothetical protein
MAPRFLAFQARVMLLDRTVRDECWTVQARRHRVRTAPRLDIQDVEAYLVDAPFNLTL